MSRYLIAYRDANFRGPKSVTADSINGFQGECDSYIFKTVDGEVVAVLPKAVVVSVVKAKDEE